MTGEKRCNDCGYEFYEAEKDIDFNEENKLVNVEICSNCGSHDWEYKLVGMKGK